MRNDGTPPRCERIDVRYRNGVADRGIRPASRRWTLNDPKYPPECEWDILDWQVAKP